MIKVKNLINANGNEVKNQFVITGNGCTTFQSYESTICIVNHTANTITFGKDWDYSNTTMKHLNNFINTHVILTDNCCAKQIRKWIESGIAIRKYDTGSYVIKYNVVL